MSDIKAALTRVIEMSIESQKLQELNQKKLKRILEKLAVLNQKIANPT